MRLTVRKIVFPIVLLTFTGFFFPETPLYGSGMDPDVVVMDGSEGEDSSVIVEKKSSSPSAKAAYEDPDVVEIEEEDLGEVCNIIMYNPFTFWRSGGSSGVLQWTPQIPGNINISPVISNVIAPQIHFTPVSYIVRRYVPARRTYVYSTVVPPRRKIRHVPGPFSGGFHPPRFGPRRVPPRFGPRRFPPRPGVVPPGQGKPVFHREPSPGNRKGSLPGRWRKGRTSGNPFFRRGPSGAHSQGKRRP